MRGSFWRCWESFGGCCGRVGCCSAGWGSRIGMEFEEVREGVFRVGDGAEWFLVDEEMLLGLTEELGAVMVDPLKTTVVAGLSVYDDVGAEEA